jgi:thiol-disulfide isomerase/thioredoxin
MNYIAENQIQEVINQNRLTLIEFRSSECYKCIEAESFLEQLSIAYKKDLAIFIISIDLNIINKYNIDKVPVFIIFKDGI